MLKLSRQQFSSNSFVYHAVKDSSVCNDGKNIYVVSHNQVYDFLQNNTVFEYVKYLLPFLLTYILVN